MSTQPPRHHLQRTKIWKESPDLERDAKLDRIEHVLDSFPDRVFAFDEFGPLGIRPTAGSGWAPDAPPSVPPRDLRPYPRHPLLPRLLLNQ